MPIDLVQSIRIDAAELPDESLIFGATAAMREVQGQIERILHTDLPVLIRGESGTGKEVVAKFLHARSQRRNLPFVRVNCGGISAANFGNGFETGTEGRRTPEIEAGWSLAELARGGTLFFDEIADMGWNLQAKLLCLLEDGMLARDGRFQLPRVVCATNCDLEEAVERHAFRRDLFYRIDVISLKLKPLRERQQDIPLLCAHFLEKLSKRFDRDVPALSSVDVQMLTEWNWPGNLRELENRIARVIVLGQGQVLDEGLGSRGGFAGSRSAPAAGPLRTSGQDSGNRPRRPGRWGRRGAVPPLHSGFRTILTHKHGAGQRRRSPRENRRDDESADQA